MNDCFQMSTAKVSEQRWITDGAWITGLVGCVSIFVIAIMAYQQQWLDLGINVFGLFHVQGHINVQLFSLILASLFMCLSELIRLLLINPTNFFNLAPELREKKISKTASKMHLALPVLFGYRCWCYLFLSVGQRIRL